MKKSAFIIQLSFFLISFHHMLLFLAYMKWNKAFFLQKVYLIIKDFLSMFFSYTSIILKAQTSEP